MYLDISESAEYLKAGCGHVACENCWNCWLRMPGMPSLQAENKTWPTKHIERRVCSSTIKYRYPLLFFISILSFLSVLSILSFISALSFPLPLPLSLYLSLSFSVALFFSIFLSLYLSLSFSLLSVSLSSQFGLSFPRFIFLLFSSFLTLT